MRLPSWLRPLAARLYRIPTPRTRQRRTFRPRLERLEDRTVPSAAATPAGITNWWPADNSTADIAGQDAGVAIGGVGYAPGEVGQAFNFTGPGQYVAVTGSSTIQGPRTIEGWVKPDPTFSDRLPIITFGPEGKSDIFAITGNSIEETAGEYKLYVDESGVRQGTYVSTATVTPGVWNHVALTYDGTTIRFFINGQAAGQVEGGLYDYPLNSATIGGNTIGGWLEQDSFSGEIDELSLYNRALSAQEIQSIYQAGPDGKSQSFIVSSSPAEGETLTAPPPTDFTLHFSQGVNSNLVQPTDLTVNGIAADSMSLIDAQTVSFHYNISPVAAAGSQTMQFGSLGWSSTFYYFPSIVAGRLDSTFGSSGLVTTEFNSSAYAQAGDETGAWGVAVQPNDGKIILVGDAGSATTGYDFVVARYNTDGTLDTTFGQNGQVTHNFGSTQDHGDGVTVQPDGKILVVGTTYNSATGLDEFAVARLLSNGALDPGFSSADDDLGPGMVTVGFDGVDISLSDLRAQLQGNKILLSDSRCGNGYLALVRLNSDGSIDNSFGTSGDGRVLIPVGGFYSQADAVVEPTGKIVIADETGRVFRLNSDGSPDNTFSNQTLDFSAYSVILDPQGNILISGRNEGFAGSPQSDNWVSDDWVVARLGADGNVDTNFGTGGEARISIDGSAHEDATSLAVQANGKIIATGPVWTGPNDDLHFAAARLTADGQLDTSFGSQGSVFLPLDDIGNVAVAPDGGILISGTVYQPSTIYDFALVRVLGDPVANADAYTADQDSTLTVPAAAGVLANDTDSSHAPLTASLVSGPAHAASFTLNTDGSFTYTPAAGYVGPDSFTYEASNGSDSSNVATVSLTVQSLQDAVDGLSTGGELTVQASSSITPSTVIDAINGLTNVAQPVTIIYDLGGGTYSATNVSADPPANVALVIQNGTLTGGSSGFTIAGGNVTLNNVTLDPDTPALTVAGGQVSVLNSTLTTSGNAPTLLVTGGNVTLSEDKISQTSTASIQPAIAVTGGTVNLGTATTPGNNTLSVSNSGNLVSNTSGNPISAVGDTFTVNGHPLTPSTLSGTVFEDFNDDGQIDFGEEGISNVLITLTGTDDLGDAVSQSQLTNSDGAYVFLNLRPGNYTITETQPSGYLQGIDSVGTAGGTLSATDQFSVNLAPEVNGENYNFGEQPAGTGPVTKGQTAGIGFWNNNNGQALIEALPMVTNADGSVTSVANWLAATLPNMFGANAGSNDLAGKSNAYVAALFQSDFVVKGTKLDAQVLATALSVYATNATLDSTDVAAKYGFTVSGDGVGAATVNVGSNGDAFGVANNTTMTVMDLLLATDAQAIDGVLYNGNTTKRNEANAVYSAINQAGSIS
jgi:uncharacterized delta-60 repeat protein